MKNMTNMTAAELTAAAKKYDNLHNEGGEGYNPYRDEIDNRAIDARKNAPRTEDDVLRDLERYDSSIARECGTYNADKVAALNAELADLRKSADDKFLAVWTIDELNYRRAAWNAEMDKIRATGAKGLTPIQFAKIQKKLGFTLDDIKKAKKLHGIV